MLDNSVSPRRETYAVRDLDGRVLREFDFVAPNVAANRHWVKDYIYAGGSLVASESAADGVRHHHRDHLGSLRLLTDGSGQAVGRMFFLPYGEKTASSNEGGEDRQYTVHERDKNAAGTDDDLDYMLARYYSPHLARFLRVDSERGRPDRPQSLNRYAYGLGNPLRYIDPNGRDPDEAVIEQCRQDPGCEVVEVTENEEDEERPPIGATDVFSVLGDSCSRPENEWTLRCSEVGDHMDSDPRSPNDSVNFDAFPGWEKTWNVFRGDPTAVQMARCVAERTFTSGNEHGFSAYRNPLTGALSYSGIIPGSPQGVDTPDNIFSAYRLHGHPTPGAYQPSPQDAQGFYSTIIVSDVGITIFQRTLREYRKGDEDHVVVFGWASLGGGTFVNECDGL